VVVSLDELERRIVRRLAVGLPGSAAQARLAPRPREGWQPDRIPPGCRDGAGLLLFYPDAEGHPWLILTVRDRRLPQHAGQVSLPGGALERGETIADAALREAREEVGVDPARVRVVGELTSLHIPVSGFVLHPVVAFTDRRPDLRPEQGEVARILEVRLDALLDPARIEVERRDYRGRTYEVPALCLDGERVWGATAMILAELLDLIGHAPDPWS